MDISKITMILSEVKSRLESLHPDKLHEAQKRPLDQDNKRLAGAKRRLDNLYGKLSKSRPQSTKINAYGTKRA